MCLLVVPFTCFKIHLGTCGIEECIKFGNVPVGLIPGSSSTIDLIQELVRRSFVPTSHDERFYHPRLRPETVRRDILDVDGDVSVSGLLLEDLGQRGPVCADICGVQIDLESICLTRFRKLCFGSVEILFIEAFRYQVWVPGRDTQITGDLANATKG